MWIENKMFVKISPTYRFLWAENAHAKSWNCCTVHCAGAMLIQSCAITTAGMSCRDVWLIRQIWTLNGEIWLVSRGKDFSFTNGVKLLPLGINAFWLSDPKWNEESWHFSDFCLLQVCDSKSVEAGYIQAISMFSRLKMAAPYTVPYISHGRNTLIKHSKANTTILFWVVGCPEFWKDSCKAQGC